MKISKNNLEIEKKFIIQDKINLKNSFILLNDIFRFSSSKNDTSNDVYWNPSKTNVDIIRVRKDPSFIEFTVKKSLSGDNTNRIEINTTCGDNIFETLSQMLGKSEGTVTKSYFIGFLPENIEVSVYQIKNDSRIFLEIEADNMLKIDRIHEQISNVFDLKQEFRSLYEIFVKN